MTLSKWTYFVRSLKALHYLNNSFIFTLSFKLRHPSDYIIKTRAENIQQNDSVA